jgi:CRISPR-associated endoribonuclease Cas6
MRLLVTLKDGADAFVTNNVNNYHVQSFIYHLLRNTLFHDLHDYKNRKTGIPSFCFSNLFIPTRKNNTVKKLLISSPSEYLIKILYQKTSQMNNISIGHTSFKVLDVSIFTLDVSKVKHIHTSTPIITRIPKTKLDIYHIDLKKPYSYFYWRKDFPVELFFDQLEQNMKRKFYQYYGTNPNSSLKFEWFSLRKQVSTKLFVHDSSHTIIGSLWEFVIDDTTDSKMLDFCIETGFGERNTMGFGFINPLTR